MKERIEARDSEEKVWVKRREASWRDGYRNGQELAEALGELLEPCDDPDHQYMRYLYAQGIAQAITNHAREVGGVNFSRAQEEAQNKNRRPQ